MTVRRTPPASLTMRQSRAPPRSVGREGGKWVGGWAGWLLLLAPAWESGAQAAALSLGTLNPPLPKPHCSPATQLTIAARSAARCPAVCVLPGRQAVQQAHKDGCCKTQGGGQSGVEGGQHRLRWGGAGGTAQAQVGAAAAPAAHTGRLLSTAWELFWGGFPLPRSPRGYI